MTRLQLSLLGLSANDTNWMVPHGLRCEARQLPVPQNKKSKWMNNTTTFNAPTRKPKRLGVLFQTPYWFSRMTSPAVVIPVTGVPHLLSFKHVKTWVLFKALLLVAFKGVGQKETQNPFLGKLLLGNQAAWGS